MKKQVMILLVICLFAISIQIGVAADEYRPINFRNGVNNDTIKVAFHDGDFNASEKYFFYVATNQWAWASRNSLRPLEFDFISPYSQEQPDGIYVSKRDFPNESVRARCYYTPLTGNSQTLSSSHIIFNSSTYFTTARSQANNGSWINGIWAETAYFPSTALHELGHALGLGHVDYDTNALMYAPPESPPEGWEDPRPLIRIITNTDLTNFMGIYGSNTRARTSVTILTEQQNKENYLYLRNIPENNQIYDIDIREEICYEPLNDSEMMNRSDLIIKGRVKEILPTEWTTTDGRPISQNNIQDVDMLSLFHYVVVEVDETYKGELKADEIIIRKSGGTSDNIRMTSSNPEYYENEEVLLCLREGIDDSSFTYYLQTNGRSQIFLIDDDLGVNGRGEKVNISEFINTVLNQ